MADFAEEHGLEHEIDESNNVIIRHPGKGRPIVLQAHLDMVPQAVSGKDFDFVSTPITPIIDGEWIHADGTTLGADDGTGVSLIMALLTDPDLKDVSIEALFTSDEEVGLCGAFDLKEGWVEGRDVINIDNGTEECITIGAAGAMDIAGRQRFVTSQCTGDFYEVKADGFLGGHSGMDIHRPRGNAGIVLAEMIRSLGCARLASFK